MSESFTSSSEATRRDILRSIALSVSLGAMPLEAAQHVHAQVAEAKAAGAGAAYQPKLFKTEEYATVKRLAELIVPADDVSPSALEAGAPEFIDLIGSNNEELGTILTGGLQWLDRETEDRHGVRFLKASPEQQTALLDLIASRSKAEPQMMAGVAFFDWMRRLTVDAFYTSPAGIKDLGYLGNKGMTVFQIPDAALQYALKRSGLDKA